MFETLLTKRTEKERRRVVVRVCQPNKGMLVQIILAAVIAWYVAVVPWRSMTGNLIATGLHLGVLNVSVFLHEFAHAVVGSYTTGLRGNIRVYGPLLGATSLDDSFGEPVERWNMVSVIAGPVANLLLACLTWYARTRIPSMDHWLFAEFIIAMYVWNLVLGIVNLFPIHPLDGGRILMMLAERGASRGANVRTSIAHGIGVGFGIAVIADMFASSDFNLFWMLQLIVWIAIAIFAVLNAVPKVAGMWLPTIVGGVLGLGLAWLIILPLVW